MKADKANSIGSHLVLDVLSLDSDGLNIVVGDPLVSSVGVHALVLRVVLSGENKRKNNFFGFLC